MTKACNQSGDGQVSRLGAGGGGGGRGDCIICVKAQPDGEALKVIQIVEGMSHRRKNERVDIPFLMVVHNPHDKPVAMRVIHRGFVTAFLNRFYFPGDDFAAENNWENRDPNKRKMMDVFRKLYAKRLRRKNGKSETAVFEPRVNCPELKQVTRKLSLDGPGGCFLEENEDELDLRWYSDRDPDFSKGPTETPAYCSYLLPPVSPGKTELFVLWLAFDGASYQHLIGPDGVFTVDSHARLRRQIEASDLVHASAEGREFHRLYMSDHSIITPAAYDIVVFKGELGDNISVETGSICVLPAQPEGDLAKQVLWFYGQPEEFYLVLRNDSGNYVSARAGAPSRAASNKPARKLQADIRETVAH